MAARSLLAASAKHILIRARERKRAREQAQQVDYECLDTELGTADTIDDGCHEQVIQGKRRARTTGERVGRGDTNTRQSKKKYSNHGREGKDIAGSGIRTDSADDKDDGGGACLLYDVTWRYLELGVRIRVCVDALRRAGRELAGRGGRGGSGIAGVDRGENRGGDNGVDIGDASVDESAMAGLVEEEAATRLEEGLSVGEIQY